jgi:hypothetical protein
MILKKMKISKNWPKSCHLKKFKELVLVYNHVSQKKNEKVKNLGKELPVLCQFLSGKSLVFQGF